MQVQKFGGRQPFVKAEIFRQESDFSADFDVSRKARPAQTPRRWSAFARPRSILIEVLLPAPFGPRKPKISPRGTVRVKSRTATLPPKTLRKFCVRTAKLSCWDRVDSRLSQLQDGLVALPQASMCLIRDARLKAGATKTTPRDFSRLGHYVIQRIGQRDGLAGISESGERINNSVFRPDQRVSRAAPSGHAEQSAVRAIHLHHLIRTQGARNRQRQRRFPVDRVQKIAGLSRRHSRRFQSNLRQPGDVKARRHIDDRIGPFAQADAIAVLRRRRRGPVMLSATTWPAFARAGQVPYCTCTERGTCTPTVAPSSDCGNTRSAWPASVAMACRRARSTATLILCDPPTTICGASFRALSSRTSNPASWRAPATSATGWSSSLVSTWTLSEIICVTIWWSVGFALAINVGRKIRVHRLHLLHAQRLQGFQRRVSHGRNAQAPGDDHHHNENQPTASFRGSGSRHWNISFQFDMNCGNNVATTLPN